MERKGTTSTRPVWAGAIVGTDVQPGATRGRRVVGDASVHVDLDRAELDVAFTSIRDATGGDHRRREHSDTKWQDVALVDGAFVDETSERRLDGLFYGSEHQEVGGTFERIQILEAFGGRREYRPSLAAAKASLGTRCLPGVRACIHVEMRRAVEQTRRTTSGCSPGRSAFFPRTSVFCALR